jgi:hypothetical protein
MAKLTFDGVIYWVDGQKLEPGMTIRRYDEVAGEWFEGKVGWISSYDHEKQQRVSGPALVVDGYAPSPLQTGQEIVIVSRAELYEREMDERNRIAYENRAKPWLPGWEDE